MEQISFFLEKFRSFGRRDAAIKEMFCECVRAATGVSLPKGSVSVRGGTFFVKAHHVLKNELHIKKNRILAELAKVISSPQTKDIR